MSRHIFDSAGRISAEMLEEYPVAVWQPPEIADGGRLVQVQPRQESPSRPGFTPTAATESGAAQTPGAATVDDEELERLREQARAEGLEQGREEGREKGYREGLEQGRQEGAQQAQEEARKSLDAELAVINRLATSLTHALNDQDYQLEQALMNVVKEVARQVIQRELQMDNSTLMPIIRQALRTLPPGSDNVRILVNPEDLPVLEQAIEEGGENWRALARSDVSRGGCRIETDQSVLDFTREQRFRQIMQQVVDRQLADPATADEPPEEAPEPLVPRADEGGGAGGESGVPDAAVNPEADPPRQET